MNIFDLNTKEKLDAYGDKFLVVTENIDPSPVTGFNRAVALLDFNVNLRNQTITLVVGVYELDEDGEPIISKSLKPYEETLVAHNGNTVDMQTEGLDIVQEDDKVENGIYMGEFDAYVYITKNNPVKLWDLFASVVTRSSSL
jgi:hypothetical protein